jgi:hypothetical protein
MTESKEGADPRPDDHPGGKEPPSRLAHQQGKDYGE